MSINFNDHDITTSGNLTANSGNFTTLTINNSNFNSSVSGLLPTIANSGDNRILTSIGSTVGINAESNLSFDGSLLNVTGSGNFASGLVISNQTASRIASFDSNKNLVSLNTSTYPSLTELSYVKGVTSPIQAQLNNKANASHTHLYNEIMVSGVSSLASIGANASLFLYELDDDGLNEGIAELGGIESWNINNLDESIDDRVNNLLVGTSGINISYNDEANSLTIAYTGVSEGGGGTAISNYGDNRLLTSDGTTTGINAESDLSFNNTSGILLVGSTSFSSSDGLQVSRSATPGIAIGITSTPSSGNSIAGIGAYGYDGSLNFAGSTINFRAAENWSSTNHGTDIQIRTTPTGTGGSLTEVARITSAGNVGIGTSTPSAKLHVVGNGLFTAELNLSGQTASTIASFDSNKNIISLSTATYPSLTELTYVKGVTSAIQTQIDGKSSSSHVHGNITNAGAIGSTANLPLITTTNGAITVGSFGTTANTFCQGNDSRLSDSRTPLSHTHGNITNAGAIGSTANLPLITTTSGAITVGSFGTTANTFCQGNDSRLSDSRAPTGAAGGDLTGTYPNPTLTNTTVVAGTYRSVTVDAKGRITGGTNPTTISGYGITDVGNGTLTLNVSGTGLSGSASFTANQSGNTTFTVTSNATSANTGSAIVARDASGNFSAGTISASFFGNITATTPTLGYTASAAAISLGGQAGPQILGQSGSGSIISFHRPGAYAVNFGLDTDNILKVGGWSMGAVAYPILHSNNYNSYAPTLTGGGASGTWGISITGNCSGTAGSETLATVTGRGTTTASIVQSNASVRAPIFYDSNNTGYYLDPDSTSNLNRVNAIGWDTTGRNYSREWIEFTNHSGLYSPLNGAHFYPNNASYGPWRIAGTRNGWNGIEFDSTGAGQINLMMNSGHTGVHNNSHGWQWYWTGGVFYVSKGANGGGTIATVLDTSNYASNAPVSIRTFRAWGVYDGSATSANPGDGINMGTMTRAGNGTYTCNFSITLPNTNYGVLVSGQVGSMVTQTRNTTSVVIVSQNLNGVQTQAPYFTVGIIDTI